MQVIQIECGAKFPFFWCGVNFSISDSLWKKTKVVLGADRRCFFEEILPWLADTTLVFFCYRKKIHPFVSSGNLDRSAVLIT